MNGQEFQIDKEILKKIHMKYLLYLPLSYNENDTKKLPLIVYLHGAGGSGADLDSIRKEGLPAYIEQQHDFPFIVVAPQCPLGSFWNTREDEVVTILDELEQQFRIDTDRVYVTGFSMGAYGVWHLALHHPHRFAAIAPVSGGGDPRHAQELKHIPAWIFHGTDDQVIRSSESEKIAEALREEGAEVELTLHPGVGHDCWKHVYANQGLYRWFLEHRSTFRPSIDKIEPKGEGSLVNSQPSNLNTEHQTSALGLYHDGTERLQIQLVTEQDLEDLLALEVKNKELFRQFAATREETFYTKKEQQARIQRAVEAANADTFYMFMIRERESGILIGNVALMDILRSNLQSAIIGYAMDQDFNGKGYMTEAVRFIVRYAFEVLAFHRIEAGVMPHNQASLRVLEKAGFEREGICRSQVHINGRWQDHVRLAIINPKDLLEEQ
ncbi:GNAT family N-acetyltransferase [Saccharibacillus sp. JS10]|uniref:GNAT family N-acetyltransferase n=1 Tax=Saccharibacillus sp. JS10 TaxID=2950552 RepID=UPI00210912CC|nr:GNAT family N-acetyltransferase [Saccharibacillus sp. JS10]MCQ4085546.1 GNAT family N-acetyltransferase [Saccharibacillus sp. JS10]